jgi:hypothetical protein
MHLPSSTSHYDTFTQNYSRERVTTIESEQETARASINHDDFDQIVSRAAFTPLTRTLDVSH